MEQRTGNSTNTTFFPFKLDGTIDFENKFELENVEISYGFNFNKIIQEVNFSNYNILLKRKNEQREFKIITSLSETEFSEIIRTYKTKAKRPEKYQLVYYINKKADKKVAFVSEKALRYWLSFENNQ